MRERCLGGLVNYILSNVIKHFTVYQGRLNWLCQDAVLQYYASYFPLKSKICTHLRQTVAGNALHYTAKLIYYIIKWLASLVLMTDQLKKSIIVKY